MGCGCVSVGFLVPNTILARCVHQQINNATSLSMEEIRREGCPCHTDARDAAWTPSEDAISRREPKDATRRHGTSHTHHPGRRYGRRQQHHHGQNRLVCRLCPFGDMAIEISDQTIFNTYKISVTNISVRALDRLFSWFQWTH